MATAKKKTSDNSTGVKATIAAATVLATAAAVFLYGTSDGAKARKKIKGWTLKAKGEVLEALEKAKDTSEAHYAELVDKVGSRYSKLKTMEAGEVEAFVKEMKQHWKKISSALKAPAKTAAKAKVSTKK